MPATWARSPSFRGVKLVPKGRGEGEQLGLKVRGDQVHRQPFLGHADAQGAAAHALDGLGPPFCGDVVDVERRTLRELDHVLSVCHGVLGEERHANAAPVGEDRDGAVRVGPVEGSLKVLDGLLAANLLQRHHVGGESADDLG